MWSRQNLEGYMAVTAHYCNTKDGLGGSLAIESELIAFRRIEGSHTGATLAKELVSVIERVNCLHKVCSFCLCKRRIYLLISYSDWRDYMRQCIC